MPILEPTSKKKKEPARKKRAAEAQSKRQAKARAQSIAKRQRSEEKSTKAAQKRAAGASERLYLGGAGTPRERAGRQAALATEASLRRSALTRYVGAAGTPRERIGRILGLITAFEEQERQDERSYFDTQRGELARRRYDYDPTSVLDGPRLEAASEDTDSVLEAGLFGEGAFETLGNLKDDVVDFADQIGPALLSLGGTVVEEAREGPSLLDILSGEKSATRDSPLFQDVILPTAEQIRYDFSYQPVIVGYDERGPLYRSKTGGITRDPDRAKTSIQAKFQEHPLNYLLVGGGAASVAGSVTGAAARRGLLGQSRRRIGEPGTLEYRLASGQTVTRASSRNPVTRWEQEQLRNLTRRFMPSRVTVRGKERTVPFGEERRAARIEARRRQRQESSEIGHAVRPFQEKFRKLKRDEGVAVVLRSQNLRPSLFSMALLHWADDAARRLRDLERGKPRGEHDKAEIRRLRGEIKDHQRMRDVVRRVDDDLYDSVTASPKLREAFDAAQDLERLGGDILEGLGKLRPESRALRPYLPARVMSGARFADVPDPDAGPAPSVERALRRVVSLERRYETALGKARERRASGKSVTDYNDTVKRLGAALSQARDELETARARAAARRGPSVSELVGGPSVDAIKAQAAGLIFRFPHEGKPLRTGERPLARSGRAPMRDPGMVKQNKALRLLTSRWIPHPSMWRDDFVKTIAYAHAIGRGQLAFDRFGRALGPDGSIPEGNVYVVNPRAWLEKPAAHPRSPEASDRRASMRIERAARERPGMLNAFDELLDADISPDDIVATIDDRLATGSSAKAREWMDEYGPQNVRQITRYESDQLFAEFRPANFLVKHLLDAPTDFWRKLTLNWRGAWFVNNIVGQHLLYGLNHATPGGAHAYARAVLAGEATPEKLRFGGLYATEQAQAQTVLAQARTVPGQATQKLGELNARYSDELPRRAAYFDLVERHRPMFNRLEETNLNFQQLLAELQKAERGDPGSLPRARRLHDDIVEQVLDELIDFGNMSNFERYAIRRVFPFYSWMKGITKATGHLAFHHPAKTALMVALAREGEEEFTDWFGAGFELLRSHLGLSKKTGANGVVARVLTTYGLSPFQTIGDNIRLIEGMTVDREIGFGSENPAANLGPFWTAFIEASTGEDVAIGEEVPGRGWVGRFASSFQRGFPQYRLYQDVFNPRSATNRNDEPRLTVPGATWHGIPTAVWNYLGVPIRERNLDAAARIRKREQLDQLDSLERAKLGARERYEKELKELNAASKQRGKVVPAIVYRELELKYAMDEALAEEEARRREASGDGPAPNLTYRERAEIAVATLAAREALNSTTAANVERAIEKYGADEKAQKSLYLKLRGLFTETLSKWRSAMGLTGP